MVRLIPVPTRNFGTALARLARPLPPRPKIKEDDIEESFIKGGGAGGQKINKTNSCVQLLHLPTSITVKCQQTRSREQNRSLARRLLAEKIDQLEKGDQSRTSLKAEQERKKRANSLKKSRRKYRSLAADYATNSFVAQDEEASSTREDSGKERKR